MRYSSSGFLVFTQIKPVKAGDLGTRPKNSKHFIGEFYRFDRILLFTFKICFCYVLKITFLPRALQFGLGILEVRCWLSNNR
jgi:hypothetical protein